jgi:hypothetical protein
MGSKRALRDAIETQRRRTDELAPRVAALEQALALLQLRYEKLTALLAAKDTPAEPISKTTYEGAFHDAEVRITETPSTSATPEPPSPSATRPPGAWAYGDYSDDDWAKKYYEDPEQHRSVFPGAYAVAAPLCSRASCQQAAWWAVWTREHQARDFVHSCNEHLLGVLESFDRTTLCVRRIPQPDEPPPEGREVFLRAEVRRAKP